jgi:mannose-1-phosphate guanylyltransferase
VFASDHIYVVTIAQQAEELQAQCPQLPKENFIIEPMPRGTASVVGLAAIVLQQRDPDAVMAILTSDHYIGNQDNFRHLLRTAYEVAQEGNLVTLGISPTFASTGYGYIQRGASMGSYQGTEVYQVLRFKEKPEKAQAEQMLESGDHSWNSGMFAWRVDQIMQEFKLQMPDLYHSLERLAQAREQSQYQNVLEQVWPELKSEAIDYGVMEGAKQVAVIPAADLNWSDVGSWDSLFDVLPAAEDGNIVVGTEHIGIDTHGSLIYGSQSSRLIVTIGMLDLILVDTGDILLVCPKDKAQQVRDVVNLLKEKNPDYL